MQFFSLNLLHRELLAVCRWISSISVSFGDKFNRKWPTKDEYRNFTVLIFHPIFCSLLQKYHFYGLLMDHKQFCCFISKRVSKISHFWKAYLKLQIVKQGNGSSIILCPHLLLICTCSTFPCRHAVVVLCFVLRSPFF
jgi:hypothetical protein